MILTVVAAMLLSSVTHAQEFPRAEIFGGYAYVNVDVQSGVASSSPIPRQSANGWEVAPAFNVNRWLGIEGDFGGYYKTISSSGLPSLDVHAYSFAGGPRFNYRNNSATTFVHALVGGDSLSGSISGVGSASQNSLAFVVGGGVQWRVKPESHWAIRGSADYVLTKHNILLELVSGNNSSLTQNNFRASVGVVYEFGGTHESAPRPERTKSIAQGCAESSEAVLLGVMGCGADSGLRVTSVRSGSPAAHAGIAPGDIVASIDGRSVHDSREIEMAIAANTSGTIKIGYMIKGSWLTEREVKLR